MRGHELLRLDKTTANAVSIGYYAASTYPTGIAFDVVPEPSTLLLLLLGMAFILRSLTRHRS
jgi:hypothetical protein